MSETDPAMSASPAESPPPRKEQGGGFSAAEKIAGVAAAYKAPFMSSAAATFMLRYETNPERREQLERYRRGALVWFGVGIAAAIIGLIVIVSIAASHGTGGSCRGGIDRFQPPTYESNDGRHWTATYPCANGGSKTVRVPANRVPGGGR